MEWFRIPKQRVSAVIGVILSVYLIFLSLSVNPNDNHWLNRLDFLFFDTRFNASSSFSGAQDDAPHIVILDIDEQSLAAEGRWPWSRYKLAELVRLLAEYGAVVVAFDVVFSEPERNPVTETANRLNEHQVDWVPPEEWKSITDGDVNFAGALPETDVVLGYFFQDDATVQGGQLPEPVYSLDGDALHRMVSITRVGYSANLPEFQKAAAGGGFVSVFTDPDGVIRRSPLVIRYGNDLYPSLALSTVMTYLFADNAGISTTNLGAVDVLTGITVGGQFARTDANGQVIVPYAGPRESFTYLSATDVLRKKADASLLEGSVVLVGTSAIGLADLRATPVGTQFPGVEVHANIIRSLLSGDFPYRPEWEAGATLTTLVLIGILLSLVLPKLGPVAALITSAVTLGVVIAGNFYLWDQYHLDLPVAAIILLVLTLTLLNLGYGYLRENASRRLLKGMFNQYVPEAHIERMLEDPDAYHFLGESKEMTVLFSDIRSFTSISENLSAADLKNLLNRYFTPVTKVIFDHDGTIDKYVGDMVMAFWGAPVSDEAHAQKAVKAALKMQDITRQLRKEFADEGMPEIHIGVGLNTGVMNVGDMGSSYRRAYTVLGDAVNLGSRLESITKFYNAEILTSEETMKQSPDVLFRYVDLIQVKGKEEPVAVYEPLILRELADNMDHEQVNKMSEASRLYTQQQWDDALELFNQLIQFPEYQALADMYIRRIAELRISELPEVWDGVYRHTSK